MDGPFYRDARMHLKTVSPMEVLVAFVIAFIAHHQFFKSHASLLFTPLCPSVCQSVGPSHFMFLFKQSLAPLLLSNCTSNMTPAHMPATGVAVYAASLYKSICVLRG